MTLLNTNGWVCKEMFSEITIGIFEEINNFSCKINFLKNAPLDCLRSPKFVDPSIN